jgi:4'-phosphopantetheinyl transferase
LDGSGRIIGVGTVPGSFDGIHIWTMSPDAVPEPSWRQFSAILDPAERERAARFVFERHRRQFTAAHALKRVMLTAAAGGGVAPAAWRFETGAHGKPKICGAAAQHFNLSHCEGAVACAFSHETEVGVDVECLDRRAPIELAESHFAASECAWLGQQPEGLRSIGFFRLWTLKEAYIKATGRGLSQRLDDFAFQFEPLRVTFADPALGDAAVWRFEQRLIGSRRHVLATAWRAGSTPIRVEVKTVDPATLM